MTALPADNYVGAAGRTEGETKTWLEQLRDFLAERFGAAPPTTLVLAGDAATPTQGHHAIDTEGAAAADNLKNLGTANIADGGFVMLRAADAARIPTVKHLAGGAGQIDLLGDADFALDTLDKWILVRRVGADWREEMSSDGSRLTSAAFGRSLLAAASATAARALLALGTAAQRDAAGGAGTLAALDYANVFTATQAARPAGSVGVFAPGRTDAHGAAADVGAVEFIGKDGGGANETYAKILCHALDHLAATEDGRLDLHTVVAGTLAARAHLGAGFWMVGATGGDPGAGKINATDFLKNGASLALQSKYVSSDTTITNGAAHTFTHGLGGAAELWLVEAVCQTGEFGYSAGDVIEVARSADISGSNGGATVKKTSTTLVVNVGAQGLVAIQGSGGGATTLTSANWKLRVTAWR